MSRHQTYYTAPRITVADGLRIWAARDVYRWLRAAIILYALFLLFLLGNSLHLMRHRQDRAAVAMGVYFLVACYAPFLVRALCRWGRGRWLLVLVLVGLLSGGCEDMVRATAHLNGYKGDIYASDCQPGSLQAGQCLSPSKKGTP